MIYLVGALDKGRSSCSKILIWSLNPYVVGYSKESSHWGDTFEYPQPSVWLSNKWNIEGENTGLLPII